MHAALGGWRNERQLRDEKNRRNIRRRGVDFADAVRIFAGPTLEQVDGREDYGEIRIYCIGAADGVVITVIYTDRGDDERRIISAWKAEPQEVRVYYRALYG